MFITLTLMYGEHPYGPGDYRWTETDVQIDIRADQIESMTRNKAGVTVVEMCSRQVHTVKESPEEIKAAIGGAR